MTTDDTLAVHEDDVREDYEIYEEVPHADMEWDDDEGLFLYDCPCGDIFSVSKEDLKAGMTVLVCPTCSLAIRVIEVNEKLLL